MNASYFTSKLFSGVREKVFAIVGVKVYAAGLYANPSIVTKLESDAKTQGDSSLFSLIFQGNNTTWDT